LPSIESVRSEKVGHPNGLKLTAEHRQWGSLVKNIGGDWGAN